MFKMKHSFLCVALVLAGLPLIGNAKTLEFSDNFSLQGPANTHIIGTLIQGNLKITQPSNTFFSLSRGDDKYSAGDLFITIGLNDWHNCDVTIHDGPLVLNPFVSFASCKGIFKYDGMDHVRGSYDYTLKFTLK